MFNYDTDLTLDSIMVGKQTSRNKELVLDKKIMNIFNDNDHRIDFSIRNVINDHDELGSSGLYTLFGENHSTLTKMYKEYTELDDGMAYCERCGDHINIFNSSKSCLCLTCDNEIGLG